MKKPRLRGNKAVFEGKAYDLKKTVNVLHRVVCATMDAFGVKEGKVWTHHQPVPSLVLPHPGLELTAKVWEKMGRQFDVIEAPIVYDLGTVTFKTYLFGRSSCVFRPDTGDIVTSTGLAVSVMDNAPIICVGGERLSDGASTLLSYAKMNVMDEVLHPFGLTIDGVNCNDEEGHTVEQKQYLSFITFPHSRFGAGYRELRAHCVLPDGKPITVKTVSALN